MTEKEYESWKESVAYGAAKGDGSKESEFCAELLMTIDALEDICGELHSEIIKQAVAIAVRCLTGGPSTIAALQHLLDAVEDGKAVIVAEPEMLGPVAGHA